MVGDLQYGDQSTFLEGVGRASTCEATKTHSPKPLRFVWHHILPRVCGGLTTTANLASLCDNCHYGVHVLLHAMVSHNGQLPTTLSHLKATGRYGIAHAGYEAALSAGTVAKIPNEGSD